MRGQYSKNKLPLIIFCVLLIFPFFTCIVNLIIRYKEFLLFIAIIVIVLVVMLKNKDIFYTYKDYTDERMISFLKRNSKLYKEIEELNSKYSFIDSKIFIDNYQLRYQNEMDINFDEYLLMTIHRKNEQIKKYYNDFKMQNKLYNKYLKEYSSLEKYISSKEAKKLKISLEHYQKYQLMILMQNKIKNDIFFKVVIYLNYRNENGFPVKSKYKNYDFNEFNKVLDKYIKIKKSGNLIAITSKIERYKMTDSLRYDILKRDNFKCCICGMTSKDGVKLHVDHIIPISKGGKTEEKNLQTLCSRCNIGKSNKV